jgi:hypothetical protein
MNCGAVWEGIFCIGKWQCREDCQGVRCTGCGFPYWEFLGGGFGVGWFTRLRDCVFSWFARQGGSAALPRLNSWMVFEIFPFFFFF